MNKQETAAFYEDLLQSLVLHIEWVNESNLDSYYYPTWIFDQLGRRVSEEEFRLYLHGDVLEKYQRRTVMRRVLIDHLGYTSGLDAYSSWYEGDHDT